MARRLILHEKLCELLGSRNVYFQPPASVQLKYPCIIYNLAKHYAQYADDLRYLNRQAYDCTYITRDPDSGLPEVLLQSFLYIGHQRHWTVDNLHHDLFRIYF